MTGQELYEIYYSAMYKMHELPYIPVWTQLTLPKREVWNLTAAHANKKVLEKAVSE